jgi:glycosyltransferase involved in cell wall biosynthesis
MRVLLVAYEFPPSPSPQALRWLHFARELAGTGMQLQALAPTVDGNGLAAMGGIQVIRTFPGPMMAAIGALRSRSGRQPSATPEGGGAPGYGSLNWKGRAIERMQATAGRFIFPDVRGEWTPWARHTLRRLLAKQRPDVVVTSHEPANTLLLGLEARRSGIPWVADLGDPVLAAYTPPHWQRRALALEAAVCREADQVVVTCLETRALLQHRHGIPASRVQIICQGFDAAAPSERVDGSGMLELLYTGRFYDFRRPDALMEAVVRTSGVRLTIATPELPQRLRPLIDQHPDHFRILPVLPHREAISLQKRAHVLVDLANDDLPQMPGKFYEYLGACRPILHVGSPSDGAARLLEKLARGWSCDNDAATLAKLLRCLAARCNQGTLEQGLDLGAESVAEYGWDRLAARMSGVISSAALCIREPGDTSPSLPIRTQAFNKDP